jgi:hypothetical protein
MSDWLFVSALRRAAEILGGTEALQKHLQVPGSELHRWLAGESVPPKGIFLRVVDVLLNEDEERLRAAEEDDAVSQARPTPSPGDPDTPPGKKSLHFRP